MSSVSLIRVYRGAASYSLAMLSYLPVTWGVPKGLKLRPDLHSFHAIYCISKTRIDSDVWVENHDFYSPTQGAVRETNFSTMVITHVNWVRSTHNLVHVQDRLEWRLNTPRPIEWSGE